jgi:hypothetical protein
MRKYFLTKRQSWSGRRYPASSVSNSIGLHLNPSCDTSEHILKDHQSIFPVKPVDEFVQGEPSVDAIVTINNDSIMHPSQRFEIMHRDHPSPPLSCTDAGIFGSPFGVYFKNPLCRATAKNH